MSLVYSTGPLENQIDASAAKSSTTVYTKVLNNHKHTTITAKIEVFRLDGTKTLIDIATLTISPNSSGFHVSDVSNAFEFEVQIKISPSRDINDVLIGVFGKDAAGNLNPSHRLVHKELTRIRKLTIE
ncbi:hypothetical protein H5P36_18170 [Bacillus sp. APMAM]|nr:hypothetical protein [Bacillus sp. APMAM]RTZ54534.1 hypothetical protein EKO25_17375 [Bacillus sp. SAJ1]